MSTIVMKFGGTSVATLEKIRKVAQTVKAESINHKIVVVLSAMAGATNKLQSLINEVNFKSPKEADLILTSGEQVTIGLLSMLLKKEGIKSIPLLGWQIPIVTDDKHEKGRILNINNENILTNLFIPHTAAKLWLLGGLCRHFIKRD